ncbi:hypothetical protein ACFWIJ_30280, partial [Streptomyces sp. NPDC127079]
MAYDSAATKERIITAATAEFAAHGVAGARGDRSAPAAHANQPEIYELEIIKKNENPTQQHKA